MLDHLHVQDEVEPRLVLAEQRLGRRATVVDGERQRLGVGAGDLDIALRGIDAGNRETQPPHRFAEQAAAAADVEQVQPLEGAARLGVAPEPGQGLFANEFQPHRIEPMQRRELAVRIPPFLGDGRKPRNVGGIDAGSRSGHGALLNRWGRRVNE